MSREAWNAVWDRIKKHSPDFAAGPMSGLECVLKWIDDHAVNPMETATFLVNTNTELQAEVKRLKRTIELKEERLEATRQHLRDSMAERDQYREGLGNLKSAINAAMKDGL